MWAFANIAGDEDQEIKKLLFKDNIIELICDISTTFPISEDFKSHLSSFIVNLTGNRSEKVPFKDVFFKNFENNKKIKID